MKRAIRSLLSLLLCIGAAASCNMLLETDQGTQQQTSPTRMRMDLTTVPVNASRVSIPVAVDCDMSWQVSLEDPSWASIENVREDASHKGSFTVQLGFNTQAGARSNTLVLKCGDKQMQKSFTQEGLDAFFTPNNIQLRSGSKVKLSFSPSLDWTVDVSDTWLKLSPKKGSANAAVSMDVTGDDFLDVGSRTGRILFTFDGTYNVEVPVQQFQKNAIILPLSSKTVSFRSQTLSIHTDSNVSYSVSVNAAWLQHLGTKALNAAEEQFSIEENTGTSSREATITFTAQTEEGTVSSTFALTQEPRDPMLQTHVPGAYNIGGIHYAYTPYFWQLSRVSGDGSYSQVLLNGKTISAYQITGIPEGMQVGESCTLHFVVSQKGVQAMDRSYTCELYYADEELLWFRSSAGEGVWFIVKK